KTVDSTFHNQFLNDPKTRGLRNAFCENGQMDNCAKNNLSVCFSNKIRFHTLFKIDIQSPRQ
ncbi:hypothetical protein ABMA27_010705, partial [Loxostege sticticalis]